MKNKLVFLSVFFFLFIHIKMQVFAQVGIMEPFQVIETAGGNMLKNAKLTESTFLQQDEKVISQILKERPKSLLLKIPIDKVTSIELSLERYDITDKDTRIVEGTNTGDLKLPGIDQFVSYRGHIIGDPEANTILSFAQQYTGGFISTSSENFIIETSTDQKNMQMIYKENEANAIPPITCGVDESEIPDSIKELMSGLNLKSISTAKSSDLLEIKVAIEADYEFCKLFQGNVDNAVFNLLNTIAAVSEIYEEDMNIRLVVSYVRVWSTPDDPYTVRNTFSLLNQFQNYWNLNMSNVNRNLAFYVTSPEGLTGSALGILGGINNPNNAYGIAVGGIFALGRTFNLSYVSIFAHEIGHILGSPHTHSCNWPGGPIDFCAGIEGDCYNGPLIQSVGTIMSYCKPAVLKFHPLCIDLIRTCVKAAPNIEIISSKPQPTLLVTPLNGDNSVTTSPILNWNFAPGADKYRIQIATNDNFTNLILDTKTEITKFTISGLKDKTQFYWRVRGENEFSEGDWSVTWRFTTSDGMIPPPPVSFFPKEGSVAVNDPVKFIWYSSTGATSYQLQVGIKDTYEGGTFSPVQLDTIIADTIFISGNDVSGGSNYWWRIRAIKGSQYSAWTEPSVFWRVSTADLQFPSNNTNLPSTLPLIWSYSGFVASSHLQVSEKEDFSDPIIDTSGIIPTTASGYYNPRIYMASLGINKTFYWRVRHSFLNEDSMAVVSEWTNGRFSTKEKLANIWSYYNSSNTNIKENNITDICIGNNNEVWLCLYGQGIARFDGSKWTIYDYESTNGLVTNSLGGLYVDRVDNNVWVGGNPQGHPTIYKFYDNKWMVYDSGNAGLPTSGEWKVQATTRDVSGMMWFATLSGLIKYDGSNWTTFNSANSPLPSDKLETLCCESNGIIWIGTKDAGLVRFDGSNWTIYNAQNSSLPGNRVSDLQLDKNNNLWVVCDNGIVKISSTGWERLNPNGLDFSYYGGQLALDNKGDIWIGGGNGIAKYDGISYKYYNQWNSPNPAYGIIALEIDDTGNVWIGSNREGLISFNTNNNLPFAKAGADQLVNEKTIVTLDGLGSFDPDRNPITYQWIAPSIINLSSTINEKPTFLAPEVEKDSIFSFFLTVNNGMENSAPDTVLIKVLNVIYVGNTEISTSVFKVYPNPTTGIIRLELNQILGMKAEISVSNLSGIEVFRKELTNVDNCLIDLSNQVSGIYLMKVIIDDQQYINKLVIRKQ